MSASSQPPPSSVPLSTASKQVDPPFALCSPLHPHSPPQHPHESPRRQAGAIKTRALLWRQRCSQLPMGRAAPSVVRVLQASGQKLLKNEVHIESKVGR